MSINIEIKARCENPDLFKSKLLQLPVTLEGEDIQVDTFFNTPKGRLKLRESKLYGDILIPYLRPDEQGPKQSIYELIPVKDPEKTKLLLGKILGIKGEVRKKREIYLFENVRIHLDKVEQLGHFIEFEAVIDDEKNIEENRIKTQRLTEYFKIETKHLVEFAYADLLNL